MRCIPSTYSARLTIFEEDFFFSAISVRRSFDLVLTKKTISAARTTRPMIVTAGTQGMVSSLERLVAVTEKCTPIRAACHSAVRMKAHGPFAGEAKNARRALLRRSRHLVSRWRALRRAHRHARPHALGTAERRRVRRLDVRTSGAARSERRDRPRRE